MLGVQKRRRPRGCNPAGASEHGGNGMSAPILPFSTSPTDSRTDRIERQRAHVFAFEERIRAARDVRRRADWELHAVIADHARAIADLEAMQFGPPPATRASTSAGARERRSPAWRMTNRTLR